MATAGPLCTERISVLSQPNSGVENPARAGEEARAGGGARGAGIRWGPAWSSSPGSVGRAPRCQRVRGSSAASLVFLAGRGRSGWAGGTSAPRRIVAGPVVARGWASAVFLGSASPGFAGARVGSSLVAGPGTWTLALKGPWPERPERAAEAGGRRVPSPRAWWSAGS